MCTSSTPPPSQKAAPQSLETHLSILTHGLKTTILVYFPEDNRDWVRLKNSSGASVLQTKNIQPYKEYNNLTHTNGLCFENLPGKVGSRSRSWWYSSD